MSSRIAELIYPDVSSDLSLLRDRYPVRHTDDMVVRFAPSPTGMLHLGAVYTCMINTLIYPETKKTFILRIEDTDQKRLVEGAIDQIIDGLQYFNITFQEGPLTKDNNGYIDQGNYGPYIQTQRRNIYDSVVKYLIEQGHAYPCFLTEEEVDAIRKSQELQNKLPGIYGAYSTYRHTSPQDIIHLLEEGKPYVIRLKNNYGLGDKVSFHDLVKGDTTMGAPHQDTVLVKSDGIPVYHLAAMVDDWLMGVTHIIRSDEWFASVPLHLYISSLFNPTPPQFAHPGPLLKLDAGNRRKLSKRKDPEADVHLLLKDGYEPTAIINYLANIINSGYEEWRLEDTTREYHHYQFDINKVTSAGAIVDMVKINSVSQDTFARLSDEQIYEATHKWSQSYHPEYTILLEQYKKLCIEAIGIERHDNNDPKRFITYQDVINHCFIFIDEQWNGLPYPQDRATVDIKHIIEFINQYCSVFDLAVPKEEWFEQLKSVGKELGYASTNAEFKSGGYIGKVGDLAMILRVSLCKSPRTPDLYETMQVMGSAKVITRLQQLISHIS